MQKRVKKRIVKKKTKNVAKKAPQKQKPNKNGFKFSLRDKTLSSAINCLKELDKRQKGESKDLYQ